MSTLDVAAIAILTIVVGGVYVVRAWRALDAIL